MAHIMKINEMSVRSTVLDADVLKDEIIRELESISEREYVEEIAENIVNDVAIDIEESADIDHYNSSDVRYAIGRVLVKLTNPDNRR